MRAYQTRAATAHHLNQRFPKQDAKTLWKALYAVKCIEQSVTVIEHILENGVVTNGPLYTPLMTGAYVLYARPFLNSSGVGLLSDKMVPKEFEAVHRDVLNLRHQMMAHLDSTPTVFPSAIPAPHIRIVRDIEGVNVQISEVTLNEYKFKWMLRLDFIGYRYKPLNSSEL